MLDNPLSEAVWKRNMTHDLMMFVGFPSASLKISYVISVTHQERIFIIVLDSEGFALCRGERDIFFSISNGDKTQTQIKYLFLTYVARTLRA